MPYIVDGHNLIPKMGMRLEEFDDEIELIERLGEFCRLSQRGQVEVYFDRAPAGSLDHNKFGPVNAYFVHPPMIADQAIANRLRKLGRAARNWSVVSSDHQVQAEARSLGAKVISSEEFACTVMETLRAGPPATSTKEKHMSERELEEWLRLFAKDDHKFG